MSFLKTKLAVILGVTIITLAALVGTAYAAKPTPNASAPPPPHGSPIEQLQAQIDTLFASVTTLDQRTTVTEQSIQSLQSQAASLQQQIQSNSGDITSLQAQLQATNAMLYELQQDIAQQTQVLAMKQNIISGTCPENQHIVQINTNGSIVCTTDVGASGIHQTTVYIFRHLAPFTSGDAIASCPLGMTVSGGGFGAGPGVGVFASQGTTTSWIASGSLVGLGAITGGDFYAQAICVSTT